LTKVDLAPGLVIVDREADKILDYGLRFARSPFGHEFSSLIRGILFVLKRDLG
jgi:alkyl hydroperoxide reductase subunit AhpF